MGTAKAIAHAYSVFATGGRELGLRPETLELLAAPAIPPTRGFYDECLKGHGIQFSLGFMKSTPALPFGSASSFGSPGAGGALGFADPATGVGYAYVTNGWARGWRETRGMWRSETHCPPAFRLRQGRWDNSWHRTFRSYGLTVLATG